MSKFKNGRVFIVILQSALTNEFLNCSVSKSATDLPAKTVASGSYYLIEFDEAKGTPYVDFVWYSIDEISSVWENLT